jgi:hypothetical protein
MEIWAYAVLGSIAAEPSVVVGDRSPIGFVLSTPTGEIGSISYSDALRIVTELLDLHTNLAVQVVDDRAVELCRGRLFCLADEARADYSEEQLRRPDGGRMSYREHLFRLEEEGVRHARYMLLVNSVAIEGEPDRISALLLDTDEALQLLHDTVKEGSWKDRIEAEVSERAIVVSAPRGQIASASDARGYFEGLVREHLRPFLETHGHWEPWGTVVVETGVDDALEILVDGQVVGTTSPGSTSLSKVSPGQHEVELRHPSYEPEKTSISVDRGESIEARFELERISDETVVRPIVLWSGVVLAVVGGAIAVYAAVRQNGDVRTACFEGSDCSRDGFLTFGYAPAATNAENVNPSGVLVAPLGYSIAAAGVVFALGTLLFGDDDDIPWIQVLAGLAVGAASYGISAAVN